MATLLRDALKNVGTHAVSEINNRDYEVIPNGAIATEKLENGALVEFDGRDSDGNLMIEGGKNRYGAAEI